MSKESSPIISNVQVSPASGPGGTVFFATVTASGLPPLKIAYQWRLDGADIPGATGAGHIAAAAGQLTVLATASGDLGSDSRESAAVQVGPALAAPATTEARIVPAAGVVGDRFAAIADATGVPVPELSYQWMRDGVAICGATAPTHTAVSPGALSVRITGRNTEGSDSRDSNVVVLAPFQVVPTVNAVEIRPGDGRVGDTFTVVAEATGSPVPELSYQWLLDGTAVAGATGTSHVPVTAGLLTVRASATNAAGSDSRESAGVSIAPASAAPRVVSAGILPGSGRVGDMFTATADVSGIPEPGLEFEWLLDGQPIAAATGASYTATAAGTLRVRVVATNAEGKDSAESGGVPVEPALAAPTIAEVTITPQSGPVGSAFEAAVTVSGNPAPAVSYQWLQDGAAIAGATGASHVAGAAGSLAVRVSATNSAGSDTRTSSVTVVPLIGIPVAEAGPHSWNETGASGVRTFDAAAWFSVPGDPTKASVTYGLMAGGGGGGPFVSGVFASGVFAGHEQGYVAIEPATGVLRIDTDASGPLDGVTVVVRASNGAGFDDLAITLTVAAAAGAGLPAELFAAAGAAGAYLDPRNDPMFQQHTGTSGLTPADGNGDPIGTIAMTTGSLPPPIYARALNGTTARPRRWESGGDVAIEFGDGVVEALASVPLGPLETGWHLFAAFRRAASVSTTRSVVALGRPGNGGDYFVLAHTGDQSRAVVWSRSTTFGRDSVAPQGAIGSVPVDTDMVASAYLGIGTQKMWVNNLLVAESANTWDGSESVAGACMRLDTWPNSVRNRPGLVYAALAYKPANRLEMSAELRTSIHTYLAEKLPS